tara:strand:- start:10940 stop:11545 length:606 start_codon:yes stop_codon:yes gene_type:complete
MTSTLQVQNLRGPTSGSNANQVLIGSGQKIVATDQGSLVAPGTVLQVKYFQLTTSQTETYGTANTDHAVSNFVVNITPQSTNSVIKLEANVMYDSANTPWSTMWFFYRDTTKLANTQASPGSRTVGISISLPSLDSDNDSTPHFSTLTYFDTPSTTSAINYKLGVRAITNNPFYINRTQNDTDNSSHDRGVSVFSAMEIAG